MKTHIQKYLANSASTNNVDETEFLFLRYTKSYIYKIIKSKDKNKYERLIARILSKIAWVILND